MKNEDNFIDSKLGHPKTLNQLKIDEPLVYKILAMFFGFAGYGAYHDCKRIGIILGLTKEEVHALKWRGLQLLGWKVKGDYFQRKTQTILLKLSKRKQKQGKTKMEFERIKEALLKKHKESKNLAADDFSIFLKEVEKAWQEREGKLVELPLYLAGIYVGIVSGLSIEEVAGQMNWDVELVLSRAEVVFCLAYPDNISEARHESKSLYGDLIAAYQTYLSARIEAEKWQVGPSVVNAEAGEQAPEGEEPKYYALVPMQVSMEEKGSLDAEDFSLRRLKILPVDYSNGFVVQMKDGGNIEEFSAVPLPSLEIADNDLHDLQDRLKDDSEIVLWENVDPTKKDVYCLFDKKH